MLKKSINFIVILWFVYSIYLFDSTDPYSVSNLFSYAGFIVFAAYFIYSIKEAAKKQDEEKEKEKYK